MTQPDASMRVSLRIKELMGAIGVGQESFANSIEISRAYLAESEIGKRKASVANIDRIVKGFGVSLKSFFDSELFED